MSTHQPQNIDEISALLISHEAGDKRLSLGKATTATLKNMLAAPANTAVSTMSSIAHTNGVNPSTLTRMAYALGFEKFSQLHKLFRTHIEDGAHYYSDKVTQLMSESGESNEGSSVFNNLVSQEASNVASLGITISRTACQEVVELLIKSRKTRFHGRRQFYSLAAFYSYCLGLIKEHVDVLQDDIHGISHSLTYMDERDLLVVMGCAPHTKATVDACRIAQSQNIPIVAITDSPISPLAKFAVQHLIIPTESQFYSNSMAAAFTLAEVTLTMTAQQMGNAALETLDRRENMIQEFGISVQSTDEFN